MYITEAMAAKLAACTTLALVVKVKCICTFFVYRNTGFNLVYITEAVYTLSSSGYNKMSKVYIGILVLNLCIYKL